MRGVINIKNSCIVENRAQYLFYSDSGSATIDNCTLDESYSRYNISGSVTTTKIPYDKERFYLKLEIDDCKKIQIEKITCKCPDIYSIRNQRIDLLLVME